MESEHNEVFQIRYEELEAKETLTFSPNEAFFVVLLMR